MTSALTRRSALRLGAAAAVATATAAPAIPAPAAEDPDACLLALIAEEGRLAEAVFEAEQLADTLYESARASVTPPAEIVRRIYQRRPDGSRELLRTEIMTAEEIERMRRTYGLPKGMTKPERMAQLDRMAELRRAYDAEVVAAEGRLKLPEARRAAEEASAAYQACCSEIFATPARTVRGVVAKLRLSLIVEVFDEDPDSSYVWVDHEEIAATAVRDLERMVAAA